jgi:hypothetical protein
VLLAAAVAALLGLAPAQALAAEVSLGRSDADGSQRFHQASVRTEAGETSDLRVEMRSGTIEDRSNRVEPVGNRADDDCDQSNRDRRLRCPPLNQVTIAGGGGGDRFTIFGYTCTNRACAFGRENFDNGPAAIVNPGPGQDTIRLDWGGTGEVRLDLRDGSADRIECSGRAVDIEVRSRDSDDDFRSCPEPGDSPRSGDDRDRSAPRASLSARRLLSRRSVRRSGIGAICTISEDGTCSVTGSISARAARAIGIRTRARRYTIVRGASPDADSGRQSVRVRLTRRARIALTRRRTRGLRVLLTAVARDRDGNASSARFTVTLRG